ncbi:CaiB/BaiF CoA transferase family protein [Hydrogenophaga sp. UC242_50]|jgi:crotonobetainyl-CoA:carnitine CoA-transferase CaiB-like acyl-CoA transferase|uniref:CaiB/BaiF CoA transferase family protein n=1 Tax=unclassified Hydrogenophaga TaxID=2610897 RepID=UPI0036D25575
MNTAVPPTCLTGQVVLDLGQLHPGPHTAMLLQQLGATVIKVERPQGGDSGRALGADTFAKYNRGKLSIALDLKNADDQAVLKGLARRSQALIEGFRPGVMDRLGVGYEALREMNPALVLCSISGFGQTGPYAQRAGHDLNYLALAGYWAVPSQVDNHTGRPNVRLSDYCGSMYAALSLVVAMMTARLSGQGQHLDVSLHDAMTAWTIPGIDSMVRKTGKDIEKMGHVMPDNDLFATADGRFIALGILEEKFWDNLRDALAPDCPALGAADFASRPDRLRHKRRLNGLLKALFATKTLGQWAEQFGTRDIPWSPVLAYDELLDDPHVVARGVSRPCDDGGSRVVDFPVKFSGGIAPHSGPAPVLDGHRDQVLRWLATGDLAELAP